MDNAHTAVTQADRDAAAEMFLNDTGAPFSSTDRRIEREYRSGKRDAFNDVQAFARHRIATTADLQARLDASEARVAELHEAAIDTAASLAAAISLLEHGGKAAKKAAPSDRMFDQMVLDYKASLGRARQALTTARNADAQGGG